MNKLKSAFKVVGQELRRIGEDFDPNPTSVPAPRPQDSEDLGPIEAEPLSDVTKMNIRREHQRHVQQLDTVTKAHQTPDPGTGPRVVLPPYRPDPRRA